LKILPSQQPKGLLLTSPWKGIENMSVSLSRQGEDFKTNKIQHNHSRVILFFLVSS